MYLHFIMSIILLTIGMLGVFVSRKNLILCLMCLELILLSITLNFLFLSSYTDTIDGNIILFSLLIIGATESAVGLCLLLLYYKSNKKHASKNES